MNIRLYKYDNNYHPKPVAVYGAVKQFTQCSSGDIIMSFAEGEPVEVDRTDFDYYGVTE